jgi:hypothetical protein
VCAVLQARKDSRRAERTMRKVLDPQAAAAARISKNVRKKASKKRKITAHQDGRGKKLRSNADE